MKTLENLTNDKTYQVIDQLSNRFNFCGLVDIDAELVEYAENGTEYKLIGRLPEDLQRAIDTMIENHVNIKEYAGIVKFKDDDAIYYLLTW